MERCGIILGCLHPYPVIMHEARNRASNRRLGSEALEAQMPRDYVHLRSGNSFVWDEEGGDPPDLLTAQGAAVKTAAELRGGLLHQGRNGSCWTVAVTDETGEIIHTVAL
jgi:hypothetical protein